MSTTATTPITVAEIRELRELIRAATTRTLTEAQRGALVELLDEIGMGIAVLARVNNDYPGEPGTHRRAQRECWTRVAAHYTELATAGTRTTR